MSGNAVPARGVLTDALLDHLHDALTPGVLVGDGEAPTGGGWTTGEPGDGTFTPYTVLSTGRAAPISGQPDTLASAHSSWACAYGLRSVGGIRGQGDYTADLVRAAAVTFTGLLTLGDRWKVEAVRFTELGAMRPNRAVDPPMWEVDDVVQIWIGRQRGHLGP